MGTARGARVEAGLDDVLVSVRDLTEVDLSVYRRRTVERRVLGRMQKVGCPEYADYQERLRDDPAEAGLLLQHATIKVSRFFRNSDVFVRLRDEILPALADRFGSHDLALWSAGCGQGEEAYSLAILLDQVAESRDEAAGGGRDARAPRVGATIYATDVDPIALARAQEGIYPAEVLREVGPEVASRCFSLQPVGCRPGYRISAAPRQRIAFLQHDLLCGAPPAGAVAFHLILCRNVLIYLERSAQQRVLELLAGSLIPGGFLCLGEAEQLSAVLSVQFVTVDRHRRLYRKLD